MIFNIYIYTSFEQWISKIASHNLKMELKKKEKKKPQEKLIFPQASYFKVKFATFQVMAFSLRSIN